MMELFYVKTFNESDIPLLISSRFFNCPRKKVKENIEKLKIAAGKNNIFIGQERTDVILFGFSDCEINTNQAKIWVLKPESISGTDLSSKAVSYLLYEGFYKREYHKLTACIKENDEELIEILEKHQWRREGILTDNFFVENQYKDGILFAMMRNDFLSYSTGMIRFLSGFLIIQATNEAVFNIYNIKKTEDIPELLIHYADIKDFTTEIYTSDKAYPYLQNALNQMKEYIGGERTRFDLNYEISDATGFQLKVWIATEKIPFGQTCTYEEIAKQLDMDDKNMNFHLLSRAVGTALGKNPIMIAIPCHRVIGKDGKLKGFAGGLEVKDYLLSHEILFTNKNQ